MSYDGKNKTMINSLFDENKNIRHEIDREIQNERERMNLIHKSDLENQENIFKRNLQQQKEAADVQNETLKKQLQQQIEFNKLAHKVEFSSKQIEEILQKFYSEKEKSIDTEKQALETKEKNTR